MDWKSLLPLECCIDAVLFMMSFISFISSIAVLGIAERFYNSRWGQNNYLPSDEKYFILSTYIITTTNYNNYKNNPVVTLIVVSLWFLFFSMICTGSSFMRVLRKNRHHDKPVQPTVTTHDADDYKILGPSVITASSSSDGGIGGGGGEEEFEEKKG
jgi:uncharacterized membrane protein YgcG